MFVCVYLFFFLSVVFYKSFSPDQSSIFDKTSSFGISPR